MKTKNIQPEIEWLNMKIINTSSVLSEFMLLTGQESLFRKKANENQKCIFTDKELDIIEEIKMNVQKSIENGNFLYVHRSVFVKEYLIPELKEVNKLLPVTTKNNRLGVYGGKRSLHLSTITTSFNQKKLSPFIRLGYDNAIAKFMKLKL